MRAAAAAYRLPPALTSKMRTRGGCAVPRRRPPAALNPPPIPEPTTTDHRLQQALEARDRQLSIATHELRTPLSSVLLNLQLLERTARTRGALDHATVQRLLAVPLRQISRMTRMVDLLLDAARVESARLVLDRQPVDLCELVHDVAGRLAEMARQAGCRIELHDCRPVPGRWDRLRLEQVVHNLVTNAIKYGGGFVEILTHADREACIEVRDRGLGIGVEDRERIFQPYERLDSAAQEDGAGLGLYIVREIVQAHGGRIAVAGTRGQGSVFTVHLPLDDTTKGHGRGQQAQQG